MLAVAGCGSGSSDNESGSSTPPAAATQTSTTPAATPTGTSTETNATGGTEAGATGVAIDMQDLKFAPAGATVKVGETVTWTNQDDVAHNVTATSGETFQSPNFGKGETFTWTAVKPGVISYTCTLHPGMNGTLNVE